ncbi:MAG: flagellar basal body P-ring formation chaperone FlgA [bacterium]
MAATLKIAPVIALSLFLALAAADAGAVKITVRESSEVSGTAVLLGDVAVIEDATDAQARKLASLRIGAAPPPAGTLTLNPGQVKSSLYHAGLDPNGIALVIPEVVHIRGRATVVTGAQIARAAVDFLRDNLPGDVKNLTVSVRENPPDVVLPPGDVQLRPVLDMRPERAGLNGFRMELVQDGSVRRVIGMQSYLDLEMEVVVAARDISAGATVTAQDVAVERRSVSGLRRGTLFSVDQAVDRIAVRNVKAGREIHAGALDVPADVNTGDLVTIQARSGNVTVTASGKAMGKGLRGDTIRVLNLGTKKILDAVIVDGGTVRLPSGFEQREVRR